MFRRTAARCGHGDSAAARQRRRSREPVGLPGVRPPPTSPGGSPPSRRGAAHTLADRSAEAPPAADDVVRTVRTAIANILRRARRRAVAARHAGLRPLVDPRRRLMSDRAAATRRHRSGARVRRVVRAATSRPNGNVPCCVDGRGADPGARARQPRRADLPRSSSYYRYTHDRAFLARMWPHIARAAAYIDTLRARRMTPPYTAGAMRAFYGLLPQSISHEGYSAKPMHSYWDDFWALRGLADAAHAAAALGLTKRRQPARRPTRRLPARHLWRRSMRRCARTGSISSPAASSSAISMPHPPPSPSRPWVSWRTSPSRRCAARSSGTGTCARRGRDSTGWTSYTPYETRMIGTLRAAGLARPRPTAPRAISARPPSGRHGTNGPRSCGATRGRRGSSATCRTRGSAPNTCGRSWTASPTNVGPTARWSSAPASRPRGSTTHPASSPAGCPRCTDISTSRCAATDDRCGSS